MPRTLYADSAGLKIAYQVFSEGPRDLVLVDGLVSHCDLDWEVPAFAGIRWRLGAMGRVVLFDKRGVGCSDRELGYGAPEDRMDDIRAVMDAAGVERATLVGSSEGGPLAVLFAATYPDRVERLVLYATYARTTQAPGYPWGATLEVMDQFFRFIDEKWGTGEVIGRLASLWEDETMHDVLARYERATASPAVVRRINEANQMLDVRAVLPAVSVPTLVVHHTDDPFLPVEAARWVASQLPYGSVFEASGLGGVHLSPDEATWAAVHEFVTGTSPVVDDRVLATVLFTDIVGSTELAARLGDERWTRLLDDHDRIVADCVTRHRGRVVKSTGDGVMAAFDGPARAVRAAQRIVADVAALGIRVRAGVHTGECSDRGADLAGLTVHIAARVAALAQPDQVLVTSTVRDLVVGAGLQFVEGDRVPLKGVPGDWLLMSVA